MDEFTWAYFEAALWSSTDESDQSGGKPLDENYTVDDIAPETRNQMINDARGFQQLNDMLIEIDDSPEIRKHGRWALAGHDFWLTRNRHGAGFEDGQWPKWGDALAKSARGFGEFDLYVGDDGLIYGSGGLPGLREGGARAKRYPTPRRPAPGPFVTPRARDDRTDVDIVPGPGGVGYNIRRVGRGEFWNVDHWMAWPSPWWGEGRWETEDEAERIAKKNGFNVIDTRRTRGRSVGAPRGIYHDMPYIKARDYVLHYREGKVPRWTIDRVGAGGTHTTIGPTRGYSDIEAVRKAIEDDAHIHAVNNATIHDASGEELGKLTYGRLHWFPGALALYPALGRL